MATDPRPARVRAAVLEHVAAFNAHDTARLLAGLAVDAVWITGQDTVTGTAELTTVFDDWLWSLRPTLRIDSLVADAERAAAQVHETVTVDGELREYDKAVIFVVTDGLITRAKVYCEGSADV